MNVTRLSTGKFVGEVIRRRQSTTLPFTVTVYSPGQVYGWHAHEFPTLFVLFAGHHQDLTRGGSFDQPPLSVVFHPSSCPHATSIGPRGMIGLNVELTDAWLEGCRIDPRRLVRECRLLDTMRARRLGLRLSMSAQPGGVGDADAAALELLACLVPNRAVPTRPLRWLSRAEEFLRTHSRESVRLGEVAAEVGLHPVYFCRAFRRVIGCTVTEYVRVLRLIDAGEMTWSERCTFAEIAIQLGFADQAHFTRTFSRAFGFSPRQLQRFRKESFVKPQS
jgi:AraC family transcriptional regulator